MADLAKSNIPAPSTQPNAPTIGAGGASPGAEIQGEEFELVL